MDVEWTGLIVSLAPQITLGDGPGRVFLRQLVDARDDRVGVDGRVLPPSWADQHAAIGMAAEAVWPPGSTDSLPPSRADQRLAIGMAAEAV